MLYGYICTMKAQETIIITRKFSGPDAEPGKIQFYDFVETEIICDDQLVYKSAGDIDKILRSPEGKAITTLLFGRNKKR